MSHFRAADVAQAFQPSRDRAEALEGGHRYLNINDVLGGEVGHGRGAYVVDTHGMVAQRASHGAADLREFARPAVLVVHYVYESVVAHCSPPSASVRVLAPSRRVQGLLQ